MITEGIHLVMIYAVRFELEVSVNTGEHVATYADRLDARLRASAASPVRSASCLFHTRRGPFHGVATVAMQADTRDQGRALTAGLKVLREAAAADAGAWDVSRARITVGPVRS